MKKVKYYFLITGFILSLSFAAAGQAIEEKEGIYYKEGKPYTGSLTENYPDGKLKTELFLKEGMKNGKVKIYSETGQLTEIRSFKMNEMHGKWFVFNEEGIKTSLAGYKNGQKEGKWMIWNDNGTLLYMLYYSKGNKTGTWKSFNDRGELVNQRKY